MLSYPYQAQTHRKGRAGRQRAERHGGRRVRHTSASPIHCFFLLRRPLFYVSRLRPNPSRHVYVMHNVLVFPASTFSTKPPPPKTNAWGSAEPVATASPAETGKAEKPSGPSVFDRLTNPERFPKRHRERFLSDDKKEVGEPAKAAGGTSPRTRVAKGPGGFRVTPSSGIPSLEDLPPPKSKAHRKRTSTDQAPGEAVHEHPSQTMPSETSAPTAPVEVGSTV